MNFNFFDDVKNLKCENIVFNQVIDNLESMLELVNTKILETKLLQDTKKERGELFYVYSYTPDKVYITKQNSNKIELLEGVTEEFKNNLAEGFILRRKDEIFSIDEELTEKSMNFELDFDNYIDKNEY